MNIIDSFEECDLEELNEQPTLSLFQKLRHQKYLSETFSTSSCTFELDKTKLQTTSKFFTEGEEFLRSAKSKKLSDALPDRLISFKQMLENKKKFLKVEKDLNELQECTFRPKTNCKPEKLTLSQICKKQLEYVKLRNTNKMRSKVAENCVNIKSAKAKDGNNGKELKVHDRLYKDSKVFLREKVQRTFN